MVRRLRRSIGIGAALALLALGVPTDGAGAAAEVPPATAEGGQGEQSRADVEELPPPRNRPTTPAGTPGPRSNARAQQVTCGQVITQNTVLRNDVGPCPGDGIVIGADNIFLNLNGHQVLGNGDQGQSGEFAGIRLPGRTGVTVTGRPGGQASAQMATVSGFEAGVVISAGGANTVENLVVRDNIGRDDFRNAELGDGIIIFDSPANRVLNNVVVRNGIFDGIGVLGSASDNTTIHGNTVEDTVGTADGGPAGQGIIVNGADGDNMALVHGTSIKDNIIRRNASAGSANINNVDAEIVGNVIEGNGLTNRAGNGIGIQAGFGFRAGTATRALVQHNEVHGNGMDGIQVADGAMENRIIDNNAADNNALGLRFPYAVDLRDFNRDFIDRTTLGPYDCDSNVWYGNTWGSGFYFPDWRFEKPDGEPSCVTVGGSGPTPPAPAPEGPYGERTCSDGVDNDRDGLIDTLDRDCEREGPAGDRNCRDGRDNDRDGLIDSDDPDCQTQGSPDDLDPLDPLAP